MRPARRCRRRRCRRRRRRRHEGPGDEKRREVCFSPSAARHSLRQPRARSAAQRHHTYLTHAASAPARAAPRLTAGHGRRATRRRAQRACPSRPFCPGSTTSAASGARAAHRPTASTRQNPSAARPPSCRMHSDPSPSLPAARRQRPRAPPQPRVRATAPVRLVGLNLV